MTDAPALEIILPSSLGPALSPDSYGARGNGIANDQDAFDELSYTIAQNGAGFVRLTEGKTYIFGGQAAGGGEYLLGKKAIYAVGVPLIVDMNGATLKWAGGLKFGAYDPATGLPYTLGTTDVAKAADLGFAIRGDSCPYFRVYGGGTIDGNCQNQTIGGSWGDTGIQLAHTGLTAYDCDRVSWDGRTKIKNMCLDGWVYSYAALTDASDPKPFFCNAIVDRVGRNCASITGSNCVTLDVIHSRAGQAENAGVAGGFLASNPASCLDIEGEDRNRNIVASGQFLAGLHTSTAVAADSGDSRDIEFRDAKIVGTVFISKPGVKFVHCLINGNIGQTAGGQTNASDNTHFIDCDLSDVPLGEDAALTGTDLLLDIGTVGGGVVFRGGSITIRHTHVDLQGAKLRDTKIYVSVGIDDLPNQALVINATGADMDQVEIFDQVPTTGPRAPADGYFINLPGTARRCKVTPGASYLVKWGSYSPGAGGWPYSGQTNGIYDTEKLMGSKTFDCPSIAAGGTQTTTVTVPGLLSTFHAQASFSASIWPAFISSAFYSGVHTATVVFANPSAGAVDPASGTLSVMGTKI